MKLFAINKSHAVSALLGAIAAISLFIGFIAFVLSIMPFAIGLVIIGVAFMYLNKPTMEDKNVD
jgi:hypothetical protein